MSKDPVRKLVVTHKKLSGLEILHNMTVMIAKVLILIRDILKHLTNTSWETGNLIRPTTVLKQLGHLSSLLSQ